MALDKRKKAPESLSSARADAYNALLKATKPLTVGEVALKSKHPKETTQQLLFWLVQHKLAKREQRG